MLDVFTRVLPLPERHWFKKTVALADHNTYEPNPDYWAALLWRQLMGHTILDATSDDAALRAYASCTPDGERLAETKSSCDFCSSNSVGC